MAQLCPEKGVLLFGESKLVMFTKSIQHHERISILSFQDKKQNHQAHSRTITYQKWPLD